MISPPRFHQSTGAAKNKLTGASGGKMAAVADLAIRIPSSNVPHIQESHITVGQIVCAIVERSLFPENT
jgi:D-sedoheptulose 7-phosphate isomerase